MALSITNLTSGSDTTNNPSTTASISPANGSFLLVAVGRANSTGTSYTVTVSGCGLTWTRIDNQLLESAGVQRRELQVWLGTGTPSSGSLTITSGGGENWTEHVWCVDQVSGADGVTPTGTSYSSYVDGSTSLTVTVSETPDAGDFVYAAWGLSLASPGSLSYAELDTTLATVTGGSDFRSLSVTYNSAPDSNPAPQITASSQGIAGISFIINAAAGAGQPTSKRLGGIPFASQNSQSSYRW